MNGDFHFWVGQSGDARLALGLALAGLVTWGICLWYNARWLVRANGSRAFVRGIIFYNAVIVFLALSFAFSGLFVADVNDAPVLKFNLFFTRTIVAAAPLGLLLLGRDIDRGRKP